MELLERGTFLDALAEYAASAARGDARLVLLSGEAGVGKTSLLHAARATVPHERWLSGACDGSFTPQPLGPLHDIADDLGGDVARLCRTETRWDLLARSLLETLRHGSGLTVVAIEDVHWADESTLDLIGFLSRRMRGLPLLLLITYRDDGLARDHPLRVLLGELLHRSGTRLMTLPNLTEDAVARLSTDRGVDPGVLFQLTGGNPFYVHEVLSAPTDSVPATAVAAVEARLARLSPPARAVVDAASIVGPRVELDVLVRVVSSDPEVVDECLTSGALISEPGAFRFRHELVRLAVEQALPAHRRAELHAAVLAALGSTGSRDDARLAHHAEQAGDLVALARHGTRAAQHAAAVSSHREAIAQYERVLRRCDGLDRADRARLVSGLTDELILVDRWQEAAVSAQAEIDLWSAEQDDLRVGDAKRQLARIMWRLGRADDSERLAAEALSALLPAGPSRELGWAHAMVAYGLPADAPATREHLQAALGLAEQFGDPALASESLNTLGCVRIQSGEDGFADLSAALQAAIDGGARPQIGRALANQHELLIAAHRFEEADRCFEEGLEYCEEHDIATFTHCLNGCHSLGLMQTGRWDQAARTARQVLDRSHVSPANRANPLLALGLIAARRGEDGAAALIAEATDIAAGLNEPERVVRAELALAEERWLSGDLDSARQRVTSLEVAASMRDPWLLGSLAVWRQRLGLPPAPPGPVVIAEPYAAQREGRVVDAARAWRSAGCPYEQALALLDAEDKDCVREALSLLDGLGARATARIAQNRLRTLGARSVPRGRRPSTRDDPLGLTSREREVLELIGSGSTNSGIAARLFISPKTVDHHVSSILAKLGVASRQAAAQVLLAADD